MEPTLAIAIGVAALATVDLTVGWVRGRAHQARSVRVIRTVSRLAAIACTSALLLGPVRSATATTPPPSLRIATGQEVGEASTAAEPLGEDTYTVVRGDSLWKIAKQLLRDMGRPVGGHQVTALLKASYEINEATIGDDPNLIHPGQVFTLPRV